MNERIRKLGKESNLIKWDDDTLQYTVSADFEELDQFAILLIKQCATLAHYNLHGIDAPRKILEYFDINYLPNER
jgi:hypothetical protein